MTDGAWMCIALMGFLTVWLGIPAVIRALRGEPSRTLLDVTFTDDDDGGENVDDDGEPLTHAQAVDIAREHALRHGITENAASYLPRTEVDAQQFEPHDWVVDAIIAGSAAGIARAQ